MSEKNATREFPPGAVARNVSGFAHDVLTLAELQAELLKADAAECARRVAWPILIIVVAVVSALGTVPVALMAGAWGLVAAGCSTWLAFLLATLAGVGLTAFCGMLGWRSLRRSPAVFERSQVEFRSNFRWMKKVLTTSANRANAA